MKFNIKKDYDYNQLRTNAKRYIDSEAERARRRLTTDGAIMSMVYSSKLEEAKSYINDPDPDDSKYTFLCAELPITEGRSMISLANMIIEKNNLWKNQMARIERIRIERKKMIDVTQNDRVVIEKIANNTSF